MSLLCPIDFRYGRPKMKGIFEEDARLQRLLEVEAALARAEAKVGLIPEPAGAEIAAKATTKHVTVKRVQALEEEMRHDLMAVVLALTEACDGDAGKYVHLGATSNDILDSATALQLRDAIRVLTSDLDELIQVLAGLATKHKRTIMLGRTHGQAAVPITFGLKMAVFASEVIRHRDRLQEAFEAKKQLGSSTMAQNENPVGSENVCSLARVVRPRVTPAPENLPLWHERDLTNSASERIILPHACVLIDEMLARTTEIFDSLRVYPDRMKENLDATKGQVMAEAGMIALGGKGLGRAGAAKPVRETAHKARTKGIHLRDALLAEPKVTKLLSKKEIDAAMDPAAYLGESVAIVGAFVRRGRLVGPSGGPRRRVLP